MACPCCSDPTKWEETRIELDRLGLSLRYCPVCSNSVHIISFLSNMKRMLYGDEGLVEVIEDENGKPILQNRVIHIDTREKTTEPEPESLAVDLDKINIDRELDFLNIRKE